ncbi:MAG: glucose-1-phosphate thymidylyltransferase [Deltaproteobacteria bacterium]|jgi:UDP-3-O-[3-hydroxymyristoyl] glucosamine N-acyltransferase|nr:glucose-1-phosphate thymidylyltransferase [Deltaproteobacteria bacterium]
MTPYGVDKFFELKDGDIIHRHSRRAEFVWELIPLLKEIIRVELRPNVSGILARGRLVAEPAALVRGEAVFGVDYGPGGGGADFVCRKDGLVLEDAALVLPGAYIEDEAVELAPGVLVEPGAMIKGPSIIGRGTEVRQGAYVRGSVLTGARCVVGHATEAKNTLMLDGAKAGHFAYLGDSLLGAGVNLGAGTKLANLKMVDAPYRFVFNGETTQVGYKKFGAVLGDGVETGCNSVTSPGVLMGPGSVLLPNTTARGGYYPNRSILRPAGDPKRR